MNYSDGWSTDAERKAFLALEKWLIKIVGHRLSLEEQYEGTGLIAAMRIAMGLPPLMGTENGKVLPIRGTR